MATWTFDARGKHYPTFDVLFPLGKGRLCFLDFEGEPVALAMGDNVVFLGRVPEDEVWRILSLNVYDRGPGAVPSPGVWGVIDCYLQLGDYRTIIPPNQPEEVAGPFEARGDTYREVFEIASAALQGVQWWWQDNGSYGFDGRYFLPTGSKWAWVVKDGKTNQEWIDSPNLQLSLWPPGAQFTVRGTVSKVVLNPYTFELKMIVLRMKLSDIEDTDPLVLEGLR